MHEWRFRGDPLIGGEAKSAHVYFLTSRRNWSLEAFTISAETDEPFFSLLRIGSTRACRVPNLAACCVSPTNSNLCRMYPLNTDAYNGPSTYNLTKIIPLCSSNALSVGARLFQLVQENIQHHRIAVDPKIKYESKGIQVFFPPSVLNSLTASTDEKRKQVNEAKRKRSLTQTSYHIFSINSFDYYMPTHVQKLF